MIVKFLFVISILISAANATQDICSVEGIEDLNWIHTSEKVIFDNHEGVVEKFPMLNIDNASIPDSPYLKATIDKDNIVISTTPELTNIEDRRGEIPIMATLVTVCAGEESSLQYVLELKDINNHKPKFEKEVYVYEFYDTMPNTNEFNLNEFQQVAATDLDFTNEKITFAIEENEYLELKDTGIQDAGDERRFVASLVLKQDIWAPFKKTFAVTATDSGEPSLSTKADIKISVLRSEAPIFTRSLYEAYVDKEGQIVMENGEIALENVTRFDDLRFDISPEYEKFFNLRIADTIKLELSGDEDPTGLISDENPLLNISIYAEGETPGIYAETYILLNLRILLKVDVLEKKENDNDYYPETLPFPQYNLTGDTSDSKEDGNNSNDNIDSKEDNNDNEPETTLPLEHTSILEQTTKPSLVPRPVYTELRGFSYWLNINKTYIALFSVISVSAILTFLCITLRRRDTRIR